MIRFGSIPFRFVSFRERTNERARVSASDVGTDSIRFGSVRFDRSRGSTLDRSTANRACAPYP